MSAVGTDTPTVSSPRRSQPAPRQRVRRRRGDGAMPYLLLAPAVAVLIGVLGYPMYSLVRVSFQHFGLAELFHGGATDVGLAQYNQTFTDSFFWTVVVRTLVFVAANVVLTMAAGMAVALLLQRLGKVMRLLLTSILVFVWAIPPLVAIATWQWMVDYEFGVVNWTLTKLHVGNYVHHNWFENPLQGFAIITLVVVWGAVPFAAITLYAGLTQVPKELLEAAQIDGASKVQAFRNVTLPILKPILMIVTILEVIWDFKVFEQVWVMLGLKPTKDYFLIGIYSFQQSFSVDNFGLGATIAVVMVLILFCVTFVYVRRMVRMGEVD